MLKCSRCRCVRMLDGFKTCQPCRGKRKTENLTPQQILAKNAHACQQEQTTQVEGHQTQSKGGGIEEAPGRRRGTPEASAGWVYFILKMW